MEHARADLDYEKLEKMIRKVVREELALAKHSYLSSDEQAELEELYGKRVLRESYKEDDYVNL